MKDSTNPEDTALFRDRLREIQKRNKETARRKLRYQVACGVISVSITIFLFLIAAFVGIVVETFPNADRTPLYGTLGLGVAAVALAWAISVYWE